MNINSLGTLYVVATPIGNLQDITLRAVEVLTAVNCIVAEDTRHSQPLLQQYAIKTKVMALHEHNERERTSKLLERLQQGESIALISDAGTPLISDPGYYLVREARAIGIKVVPLPGACAAIAALSVAGLPTDRFIFEGFLSAKSGPRLQRLERLRNESRTMVFYEAPHRILDLLQALQQVFGGDRQVVLAREITKMFETIKSDVLNKLIPWVEADSNQQRGEFVVIVAGMQEVSSETEQEAGRILGVLLEALPLKQAVELASKITGQKKNDVYQAALQLKNNS
jgi:16S rRNA (cytidine1402-2'-O)-methyltransferase